MNDNYKIEEIGPERSEVLAAMELVWRVFEEFEAPEYSAEGVEEFKAFIAVDAVIQRMTEQKLFLWGCFDGASIIGVIATREPCHISLLFVDKLFHRQGIAGALYNTVLDHYKNNSSHRIMTVNSSPYAVAAYGRLGFKSTDQEQTVNGIRFIPMQHIFTIE